MELPLEHYCPELKRLYLDLLPAFVDQSATIGVVAGVRGSGSTIWFGNGLWDPGPQVIIGSAIVR